MTPDELLTVRVSAKLAAAMPELTAAIQEMAQALQNRVFEQLRKGTLTPDAAYASWVELSQQHRLLQKFEQKTRMAASVTERLTPNLQLGDD